MKRYEADILRQAKDIIRETYTKYYALVEESDLKLSDIGIDTVDHDRITACYFQEIENEED